MSNQSPEFTLFFNPGTFTLREEDKELFWIRPPRYEGCAFGTIKAFDGQRLAIESRFPEKSYKHTIVLYEDRLQISCSCGSGDPDCFHNKGLLKHLVQEHGMDYFERFKSFPFDDLERTSKYFDLHFQGTELMVGPKKKFGQIYNRFDNVTEAKPEYWAEHQPVIKDEQEIIGYTLGCLDRNFYPPFLIPYQAVLNADKTGVRSYMKFLDLDEPQPVLTQDQRLLHSYCADFNKLRISQERNDFPYGEPAYYLLLEKNRDIAFNYWKELVPVLRSQPYLTNYYFHRKIVYRQKPEKWRMLPITFADQKVRFGLVLKELDRHLELSCWAYIKNRPLKIEHAYPAKSPFFFYLEKTPQVRYLFKNLKEAAIVNGFKYDDFRMTILKEDAQKFNEEVLKEWAEDFPVTFKMAKDSESYPLTVERKQLTFEEREDAIYLRPKIKYDKGRELILFSEGTQLLEITDNGYLILQRDKIAEENFQEVFLSLHPALAALVDHQVFHLPKAQFKNTKWLKGVLKTLKENGISVAGLESLKGISPDLMITIAV